MVFCFSLSKYLVFKQFRIHALLECKDLKLMPTIIFLPRFIFFARPHVPDCSITENKNGTIIKIFFQVSDLQ